MSVFRSDSGCVCVCVGVKPVTPVVLLGQRGFQDNPKDKLSVSLHSHHYDPGLMTYRFPLRICQVFIIHPWIAEGIPPHNPGPDYVITPGVSAPFSPSRSLEKLLFPSVMNWNPCSLCFCSMWNELQKRWRSPPHCCLATASQSLHPCRTQSLLCSFLPPLVPFILSHSCSASANTGSSLCLLRALWLVEAHFLLLSDWLRAWWMMSSV